MSKLSNEDLEAINALRDKLANTVSEAGQLTLQIELLKSNIVELSDSLGEKTKTFKELIVEEEQLVKRLSDKYGIGTIDFTTGEFTPEK
jgi:predicted  nucleic acid-binding Zn-ribbon protein